MSFFIFRGRAVSRGGGKSGRAVMVRDSQFLAAFGQDLRIPPTCIFDALGPCFGPFEIHADRVLYETAELRVNVAAYRV